MGEAVKSPIEAIAASLSDDPALARAEQTRRRPRAYLGASIIGKHCHAQLVFALRGFKEIPPDVKGKIIFGIGHGAEAAIIERLKHAMELDGKLLLEQPEGRLYGGHVRGHADAAISDIATAEFETLIEIKTMRSDKFRGMVDAFQRFVDLGKTREVAFDTTMRSDFRDYHQQVQLMMGMFRCPSTVFIIINKDTADVFLGEVAFDNFVYHGLKQKIETVLAGARRHYKKKGSMCGWCPYGEQCWSKDPAHDANEAKTSHECRTCQNSIPLQDGRWFCVKHREEVAPMHLCSSFQIWEPMDAE